MVLKTLKVEEESGTVLKTILTGTEGGRESGMVLKTILTGTEGEGRESGIVLKTI